MKKIVIISNIPMTADNHKTMLKSIFSNVSIDVVPVSEAHAGKIAGDVALVTAMDIVPYAQKYLRPGAVIVQSSYTLLKEQLEEIRRLAQRGPVTIVHENFRAASTRMTLLQRLGIPRGRMNLWYPGIGEERITGSVVLFANVALPLGTVPALRIMGRTLTPTSIFELALGLGIHDITSEPAFNAYCQRVCTQFSPSIDDLSVSEFNTMVGNEMPQRGLVAFTQRRTIFYCDTYVASLAGKPVGDLIGQKLFGAFPFLRSCEIHRGNAAQEQLVVREGKTYAVKLNLVMQTGRETGYLQISDYWEEEQRQGKLRRQVSGSKSKAKYTFEDIVGSSAKIAECKKIARRMACSNSSVLISGATGVGKELFAQSIHNISGRKNQPFIAINCGAIVESLLESELFGYEKGAFTGANKGGKQGLFELAHKGTLFLDEIGEMPQHLQVRLLRVLQEKEIVRVGGDMIIPVDVRVIAATNKDIPHMVRQREFRSDLFYRLNVLPLHIPPLSERREDILPLIVHFQQDLGVSFRLSPEAEEKIMAYSFPGNVRELHNCVEYLSNLGLSEIRAADLPPYLQETRHDPQPVPWREHGGLPSEPQKQAEYLRVLRAVSEINGIGSGAGRRSIHTYLAHQNIYVSEAAIRKILLELSGLELVRIGRGRGGIHLTEQGKILLSQGDDSIRTEK